MQNRTGFQGIFVTMVTKTYFYNSVVGWFMRFVLGLHVPWAIHIYNMTGYSVTMATKIYLFYFVV